MENKPWTLKQKSDYNLETVRIMYRHLGKFDKHMLKDRMDVLKEFLKEVVIVEKMRSKKS